MNQSPYTRILAGLRLLPRPPRTGALYRHQHGSLVSFNFAARHPFPLITQKPTLRSRSFVLYKKRVPQHPN